MRGQDVLDAEQRVVGDIEAEHLPLEGQQGRLVPLDLGDRREHDELDALTVIAAETEVAEEGVLTDRLLPLLIDEGIDVGLVDAHQPSALVPE